MIRKVTLDWLKTYRNAWIGAGVVCYLTVRLTMPEYAVAYAQRGRDLVWLVRLP